MSDHILLVQGWTKTVIEVLLQVLGHESKQVVCFCLFACFPVTWTQVFQTWKLLAPSFIVWIEKAEAGQHQERGIKQTYRIN